MTLTRTWPYPDLRNGTTIHHITDIHFGAHNHDDFVRNWQARSATDLGALRIADNAGHVNTGDNIHSYDGAGNTQASIDLEESWYLAWRAQVKADGKPFAEAVGNHDLVGPGSTKRKARTAKAWATAMGLTSQNNVYDMGDIRLVTIGPDIWPENTDYVLSATTLAWLNQQLVSTRKPVVIGAHLPWNEFMHTRSGAFTAVEPANPGLVSVVADNKNVVGWLSGHRHVNIRTNKPHASTFTVGGRKLFGICGPAAGGGRSGISYQDHQRLGHNESMYVTYLGGAVDIRWRDHNGRRWTGPSATERVRHLTL